ncbi:MAG: hypothetical protein JJU36_07050 [Phycisphaeraceae bacterium]|nr:hypothetical protein [Phycisphaeraceae bacterium]
MNTDSEWVRPVSKLQDGAIPWFMRQIDGKEPELLDVLSIPLAMDGPDFGHQPENRQVLKGAWKRTGRLTTSHVLKLCETRDVLLHTHADRVSEAMIASMPLADRYSLQLIHVVDATFYTTTSFKGKRQHRVRFTYADNGYDIVVTDPLAEDRIARSQTLNPDCILTASMGGPYDGNYFKFVAAVIER